MNDILIRIGFPFMGMLGIISAKPVDISKMIAEILVDTSVPAISAALVVNGKIAAAGVSGIRKVGHPERATLQDKFHIGSCTKSMTAVLAAILVDEGKIAWNTRVSEVFPGITIQKGFQKLTLRQLLTNTGGTPHDVPPVLWEALWKRDGMPSDQRVQLMKGILSQAPQSEPGTLFEYSNSGFAIAGAMLEKVAGKPYEDLLTDKLFRPLKMESAGFRAPATNGKIDHPYGHIGKNGKAVPINPEPAGDNPPAIVPAGGVHCSLMDFARYARFHLGVIGQDLISPDSFKMLHSPPAGSDYAMGWVPAKRDWAGGSALTHTGTNTMFYTVMWIAPEKNFAVLAMCNYGGEEGFRKCDETVAKLIAEYLEK